VGVLQCFAEYDLPAQDIKERKDEDLLVLPTDAALFEDPSFKVKWIEVWE